MGPQPHQTTSSAHLLFHNHLELFCNFGARSNPIQAVFKAIILELHLAPVKALTIEVVSKTWIRDYQLCFVSNFLKNFMESYI